ncbi:hypothetical protein CR513_19708, partial [Mucuna pruriens]
MKGKGSFNIFCLVPQSIWILDSRLTTLSLYIGLYNDLHLPKLANNLDNFQNTHRRNLDPRVVKCGFIGNLSNKKGFKCYHPLSRRVFIPNGCYFS